MIIRCLPKKGTVFVPGREYGSNLFDDAVVVRRTEKSVWLKIVPEEYNRSGVFRKKVLYDLNGNEIVLEGGCYRHHEVGWFSNMDRGPCT